MADTNTGDILNEAGVTKSSSQEHVQNNPNSPRSDTDYLKQILEALNKMLADGQNMSQSAAKDTQRDVSNNKNKFQQDYFDKFFKTGKKGNSKSFTDAFESSLYESFLGSDFKKNIGNAVNEFAKMFGSDLESLEGDLGEQLGKVAMDAFKNTSIGKKLDDKLNQAKSQASEKMSSGFINNVSNYAKSSGISDDVISKAVSDATGKGLGGAIKSMAGMFEGGMDAGAALSGLGGIAKGAMGSLGKLAAGALPAAAAAVALDLAMDALTPAIEGAKQMFEAAKKAGDRYNQSRMENLKNWETRAKADLEAIVREPFNVLQDAAQKVYDAWDANLRLINQTQGYNKADYQDLMSAYANRLREEGLTSVVSGADITNNLAKILDAGLSGAVAEEFAYQATKLNSAIPTQDFFSVASTYASLAQQAMMQGKDQSAALSYANSQLELFASNVLYASRQIGGGFSTGLKDATSLFEESVKIAQASRTGNPSDISGVLAAVSAITGAIAPDLASSMVDTIVKMATGGNSTDLVALRSLAGINASNTEFLRKMADDPKGVFTEVFSGLGRMQNIAPDAYMEAAEGLADIFGVSMDALSRIDFNKLSDAIQSMSVNSSSLNENLKLLQSGESTTSPEMQRMAQVNQYMLEEGLSYVLDDNVTRSIQEHMWDEQIAREIMEATYAVELKGSALTFLEGIRTTIDNLLTILNPFKWGQKIADMVITYQEEGAQVEDIQKLLDAVKVGSGNALSYYQLTTRNKDLNAAPSYYEMVGVESKYAALEQSRQNWYDTTQAMTWMMGPAGLVAGLGDYFSRYNDIKAKQDLQAANAANAYNQSLMDRSGPTSLYNWGSVSKSSYAFTQGGGSQGGGAGRSSFGSSDVSEKSVEAAKAQDLQNKLEKYMSGESISEYLSKHKDATYEDWVKNAENSEITDWKGTLEKFGISEEAAKGAFAAAQTSQGAMEQARIQEDEEQFRTDSREFYQETRDRWEIEDTKWDTIIEQGANANDTLLKIMSNVEEFKGHWVDRYVTHAFFDDKYDSSEVKKLQDAESDKQSTAIYALADALTQNTTDLKDPTMQTNAILAQILLVIQAIMQQNNTAGKLSLPDSLSAMATGMMNYSG